MVDIGYPTKFGKDLDSSTATVFVVSVVPASSCRVCLAHSKFARFQQFHILYYSINCILTRIMSKSSLSLSCYRPQSDKYVEFLKKKKSDDMQVVKRCSSDEATMQKRQAENCYTNKEEVRDDLSTDSQTIIITEELRKSYFIEKQLLNGTSKKTLCVKDYFPPSFQQTERASPVRKAVTPIQKNSQLSRQSMRSIYFGPSDGSLVKEESSERKRLSSRIASIQASPKTSSHTSSH